MENSDKNIKKRRKYNKILLTIHFVLHLNRNLMEENFNRTLFYWQNFPSQCVFNIHSMIEEGLPCDIAHGVKLTAIHSILYEQLGVKSSITEVFHII